MILTNRATNVPILTIAFLCLTAPCMSLTTMLLSPRRLNAIGNRRSPVFSVRRAIIDPEELADGKIVHYRSLHRLAEESDVLNPKALEIEERHAAKLNDQSTHLEPYGRKLLILRNYEKDLELLRFHVHEDYRSKSRSLVCKSPEDFAPILYMAAEEPNLVLRNKVMELSCNLGLMGLLGSITVGILHDDDKRETEAELDARAFPTRPNSNLPPNMHSLTLTDSTGSGDPADILQEQKLVTKNSAQVANAAVGWREFDWRLHPRFNPVKTVYGGILSNSNNLDLEYPTAKELARTVAHYLEPNGRFLHICPENCEELEFLKKFLNEGYLLSLDDRPFTVESCEYKPQILKPDESASQWELDRKVQSNYIALIAAHHPDYDGYNGEYLFPMENGKYDNKNMKKY